MGHADSDNRSRRRWEYLWNYGVGGANQAGVVYAVSPSGLEKILYTFDVTTGSMPIGGVVLDAAGNLFGTTYFGSDSGGLVYKLTPAGTETVLFQFTQFGATGSGPDSAPVLDESGNLYGTTIAGGVGGNTINYDGVLYRLTPQ